MVARANQERDNATVGSGSSLEKDGGGPDEDDSKPSAVASSALIGSDPVQAVIQEEEAPDSGHMAARTIQRRNAPGSCSSLEKDGSSVVVEDGGRDEEKFKPSLVTSGEPIGSGPGQDAVQEEASPDQILSEIPSGWTRYECRRVATRNNENDRYLAQLGIEMLHDELDQPTGSLNLLKSLY
jgi:hypothetical protein